MAPVIRLVLLLALGLFFLGGVPQKKVVFLDVGQGDAILMQDGWTQVLVDGGPGMKVLPELGRQMPFMDRKIEVVVLTHPQQDHMEGLLHVLDRYEVGLVLIPRVATDTLLQKEWIKRIQAKGIEWRFAWAGQRVVAGDIELRILAPFADGIAARNVNDASVVARLDFNGKSGDKAELSFLLTGDAEKKVENRLIARIAPRLLDVDILKAGHHGSKTSTTKALVEAATPQAAVISVGRENKFGHPSGEVLERLAGWPVWRTDINGAVKFALVDGRWYVRAQKREIVISN